MTVRDRLTQLLLLTLLLLLPLSACRGPASSHLPPAQQAEFDQRLRTALDQIRRNLPESARAELEACARIAPEYPELIFHRARMRLLDGGDQAANQAVDLLHRVIGTNPDSVKTHRLLYEIESSRGNTEAARQHADEVERIYGAIGTFEMLCFKRLLRGDRFAILTESEVELVGDAELDPLLSSLDSLRRVGSYSPGNAVLAIEEILGRYPDLAAVRFFYLRSLVGGPVRMDSAANPELSPLSSAPVLEAAQLHHERVFDQLHPRSRPAQRLLRGMAWNQTAMGEFADAIALTEALLGWPSLPSADRPGLYGQKAIAHFKLDQLEQCAALLETSLARFPNALRLEHRWILRITRERLGDSGAELDQIFRLRSDLTDLDSDLQFADIGPQLGIDRLDGYGPNAWGDFDRDGDFDLFVSGGDAFSSLFRNDGQRFTEVTQQVGLGSTDSGFSSTFVDYDNDGWQDIYVGRNGWLGPGPNALFHNRGDGTFADVTATAGLGDTGDTFVQAWSDVDRDGDVDLFICNGITLTGAINRLYRNNGDGTFTDVTTAAGLEEPSGTQSIGAAFGDYDRDGWPDLFVSGCYTYNRLYHNRGDGTFDEVATAAGADGVSHFSAGYVCFFSDFNNDTWPDILRTSLAPWKDVLMVLSHEYESLPLAARQRLAEHSPRLYLNNRDGTFSEVSFAAGLVHPSGTMGANVGDVDNDGWLDIYFGTGSPLLARLEPDRFYRANGDGTFSDLTFVSGLGNRGKGHGITMCDLDGDGDLDIYAAEGGMVHGDQWNNAFYRNLQSTGNHWLHIDLEGVASNRDGLDTKLTLTSGARTLYREAHNGEGFGSTNSPTIEFGIGRATKIDRLELQWPSGTVQVFEDLAADQRIFVREGESWQPWTGLVASPAD